MTGQLARASLLVRNVHLATMVPGAESYGAVRNGAVLVRAGRITWVGPESQLPPPPSLRGVQELDGGGRWVSPGLVDCHTHLVFGGNRAAEFERRLGGATYEEIAREGGGILSTVSATRAASQEDLMASGEIRLRELARRGVTTVEIKSGYGLEVSTELRMLRAARALGDRTVVRVRTTLLGAHALPPEFSDRRGEYIDLVAGQMVPEAARLGLAHAVDAFCEGIAFSPEECARVFEAARAARLPVRLHADQLSDQGGAALAARYGALSADHLEHASEAGVRAMAAAGTVAVLLPGAAHFLRDPHVPPVDAFREHGVPMAVATDLNPGSSPLLDPLGALSLACVLFRLTPEEALAGMTRVAAGVLGLGGEVGILAPDTAADLVLWSVDHPSELSYWMGGSPAWRVIRSGTVMPT
ncbi:MAG TPA: imidazolonepropionase [Longimicrobiales bacterium]|nr:imidazolonepropionase [Longimicrobiales bacterium]